MAAMIDILTKNTYKRLASEGVHIRSVQDLVIGILEDLERPTEKMISAGGFADGAESTFKAMIREAKRTEAPTAGFEWVRVEDAPTDQRGLVWVKDGDMISRGSCIAFGKVRRYESDPKPYPSAEGYMGDFTITHWAPLPEAPTE